MTSNAFDAQFVELASSGTLEEVQKRVKEGLDLRNRENPTGRQSLYAAVIHNDRRPEVFRYLLGAVAPTALETIGARSLIDTVVLNDRVEHLHALVDHGQPVEVSTPMSGKTPLMYAAMSNNGPAMTHALLERGALADSVDHDWHTALHFAGHPEIAHALLDADANIEARTRSEQTPLAVALSRQPGEPQYQDHRNVARALIARGANVNAILGNTTLLHAAAQRGDAEAVSILLEAGASADVCDRSGQTALIEVLEQPNSSKKEGDRLGVIDALIASGVGLEAEYDGQRPIHIAARKGDCEAFSLLLKGGADISARTSKGYTLEDIFNYVVIDKADQLRALLNSHRAKAAMSNAASRRKASAAP